MIWDWYKRHEKLQWALILVPLWSQPLHMWAMGEQVVHNHGLVDLNELQYHLSHWNFLTDVLWLSIDYLEFVAIVTGTDKFIRYLRRNK